MYLARYGSGQDSFVVAAISLPRPADGPSPRAQAWRAEYLAILGQALACRDLDIGFRVEASGPSLRRSLLLATTSEGEGRLLDLCQSFRRLDTLESGSVEFCPDRATHDHLASNFPVCRSHVSHSPFRFEDCAIACGFRAHGILEPMMAAAQQADHRVAYQANLRRNSFDPEAMRQARKNLVRLSEHRHIPRPLLEHQRALVDALPRFEWLIDEYVGASDPRLWSTLRGALDAQFAKSCGHLGFGALPLVEDRSGDMDDFLATGLHSSVALRMGAFDLASAAITGEDALGLLTWSPSWSRSKAVRRIFISYRREDSRYIAGRVYERLIQHFHASRVFIDVQSIPLGIDFRDVLANEGSEADVLLAVIGPRWAVNAAGNRRLDHEGDYVRQEIEVALRKTAIIPLLVDGAEMPKTEDLPPSLHSLPFLNGMPIRPDPDFDSDIDRLLRRLDESTAPGHRDRDKG